MVSLERDVLSLVRPRKTENPKAAIIMAHAYGDRDQWTLYVADAFVVSVAREALSRICQKEEREPEVSNHHGNVNGDRDQRTAYVAGALFAFSRT